MSDPIQPPCPFWRDITQYSTPTTVGPDGRTVRATHDTGCPACMPSVAAYWPDPPPRCETSYGAAHGECAVWVSGDTLCSKPLGHDGNHRGYDPSGSGRWIEYDAAGNEVGRSAGFR